MCEGLLRMLGVVVRGAGRRRSAARRRAAVVARAVEGLESRRLLSGGGYTAVELTPDLPAYSGAMVYGTLPSGTIYGSYMSPDTYASVGVAYRVSDGRSVELGFDPWGATAGGDLYGNGPAADGSGSHGFAYFDATGRTVDLGTLGGTSSTAAGGTAGGKMYGISTTAGDAETHVFLYDGASGVMTDVGGFGGNSGYVYGATAAGDLYGWLGLADGTSHGFVYLTGEGRLVDVGTLGGANSGMNGALPSGEFFGSSETAGDGSHAFLYDPETGVKTDLGGLGGSYSSVYGVLPSGDLYGSAQGADGGYRAVLFRAATGQVVDVGALGGTSSSLYRVLPSGDLAGDANLPGDAGRHAVIYDVDRGELIDLGTLGGTNSSIDGVLPSGDVYGRSDTAGGTSHGFLYNVATGRMIDVSLSSDYSAIESVTHSGDLYGFAYREDGEGHAFVYHRATGVSEDLGTLGGSESYSTGPYVDRTGALPGYSTTADGSYRGMIVRRGVMTDVNDLVQPGLAGPISYLRADQQGTTWGYEASGYFVERLVALVPNDPISTVAVSAGAVSGSPGAAIDGVVGTFTDDRADAAAGDFTVVIDWGDGATTYGTSVRRADGGWDVVGSHAYAAAGTYRTTVTVSDEVGGGFQSASGSAKLVAPIVAGQTRWAGQAHTVGTATTFARPGTTSGTGDFTATIDWGDGTTSAGLIVRDPQVEGGFVVLGSHTYAGSQVKQFLVTVEIVSSDGAHAVSSVWVTVK